MHRSRYSDKNDGGESMRVCDNGIMRDATPEELNQMRMVQRDAAVRERTRPMSAEEVLAMLIPTQINTLAVDDNTALRMINFYPEWAVNVSYAIGFKVQRNGKLYRVVQAHTSLAGWEPENALSLWEQINETHSGAEDDPIPYEGNMALVSGLYYIQDGVWYRCIRDTGNPVYHRLEELVGTYVERI